MHIRILCSNHYGMATSVLYAALARPGQQCEVCIELAKKKEADQD